MNQTKFLNTWKEVKVYRNPNENQSTAVNSKMIFPHSIDKTIQVSKTLIQTSTSHKNVRGKNKFTDLKQLN